MSITTVNEVVRALDGADTLVDALAAHCAAIQAVVPFDQLVLVLFEPDGEHMAIRWQTGPDGTEIVPVKSRRISSMAGTPAEWLWQEQRTLFENDTTQSHFAHHPVRNANRRSFILAPLTVNPVIGVLGFSTFAEDQYERGHIPVAEAIAEAIGRRVLAERW